MKKSIMLLVPFLLSTACYAGPADNTIAKNYYTNYILNAEAQYARAVISHNRNVTNREAGLPDILACGMEMSASNGFINMWTDPTIKREEAYIMVKFSDISATCVADDFPLPIPVTDVIQELQKDANILCEENICKFGF